MTLAKSLIASTVAVVIAGLCAAACPAAGHPRQPSPPARADAACTGKQNQPMSEAFFRRCMAPLKDPPTSQVTTKAVADPPDIVLGPPIDAPLRFITLPPVHFAVDKADLSETAKQTLDRIAAYLQRQAHLRRILVYGNADATGSRPYNYNLSDRRTKAVEAYLVSRGMAADLFHGTPQGKAVPIDEYWTQEGRKHNRRVELYAVLR